jgi:hypothetical protein
MPELMTIPISVFEYSADFGVPVFQIWMDRAKVVQALFEALQPWKLQVDNVESITTGKPSEQGINFKLPEQKAAFFISPAGCKFTKDAVDWFTAEETIRLLDTARSALLKSSGAVVAIQRTTLAMHLQLKTKPFLEILKPFIAPSLTEIHEEKVITAAIIVKWEKSKLIMDGSGSLANGIFLRFEREYPADMSFEDIEKEIKKDEGGIFKLLDVEEDLS